MPNIPSSIGLHLRYRLWIAELNHFKDVLRILNDYVKDKKDERDDEKQTRYFKEKFSELRKANDELNHQMQLNKMQLSASLKNNKPLTYKTYLAENHAELKDRFMQYSQEMEKLTTDLRKFINE